MKKDVKKAKFTWNDRTIKRATFDVSFMFYKIL